MAIHLSELASTVYDICLNVKDHKVWPPQDHGYFVVLTIWLALHVITMIAMLAVSDSTTKEVPLMLYSADKSPKSETPVSSD